jgi:hypothetical protein
MGENAEPFGPNSNCVQGRAIVRQMRGGNEHTAGERLILTDSCKEHECEGQQHTHRHTNTWLFDWRLWNTLLLGGKRALYTCPDDLD